MDKYEFLEFDIDESNETYTVVIHSKYIVSVSLDKYKHLSFENESYVLADTERNRKNIERLL